MIDIVECYHDLLCCRVNGHQCRRLTQQETMDSGQEFECTECDARGISIPPHAHQWVRLTPDPQDNDDFVCRICDAVLYERDSRPTEG